MCRNIRPLNNFEPPASRDEVTAAALQYVRKVAGTTKPSQANEAVFYAAVKEIAHITEHLLDDLVTTAPFAYIRMHAGQGAGGGFTREQLEWWAGRIGALRRAARDCYVYFNNVAGGHAPRDARALLDLLDAGPRG